MNSLIESKYQKNKNERMININKYIINYAKNNNFFQKKNFKKKSSFI